MSSQDRQPADFVVRGSAVYTLDSARPWAEAVAVRDGKVLVVGDEADVGAVTGARTRVISAEGGMVMPGLIDVHSHVGFGGQAAAWELGLSPAFRVTAPRASTPTTSATSRSTAWAWPWTRP